MTVEVSRPIADLALDLAVDDDTPRVGDSVSFDLTLSNAGPDEATGVAVRAPLRDGYTHVSDDAAGAYDPVSGAWTIAALPAGASITLSVTAAVLPAGNYTYDAEVTASEQDDPDSEPNNGVSQDEDDDASLTPTPVAVA